MSKKKTARTDFRSITVSLLAALLCVVIGLILGFLFLVVLAWITLNQKGETCTFATVIDTAYSKGFVKLFQGGFSYLITGSKMGLGQELAKAAPLIMTGLSVGFAFKTGLFNIGAAGQYVVGACGALVFAIILGMPWWACLIAATVFGAVWGAIPGLFKAWLNINEVITCIMFNWIALYGVNTIIYGGGKSPMYDLTHTKTWVLRNLYPKSVIPNLGMADYFSNKSTTIAIFLAIIAAIIVYIIISKTIFGYELKACGHNKFAAKYAGINEKKNIILAMTIAGALAGFGAGLYYLSGAEEWNPQASTALPAMGFDGISVALLASSHPIGTILSGLFISHLKIGGGAMNMSYFPKEISDAISGIIIYLCAFVLLFRIKLSALLFGGKKKKDDKKAAIEAAQQSSEPVGGKIIETGKEG